MIGIAEGRIVALIFLLVTTIAGYTAYWYANKGRLRPTIKRLEALEHIDEAIGRSLEMGRSVHFTGGSRPLGGTLSAQVLAGVSLLTYMTRKCAQLDTEIIATAGSPTAIPLFQDFIEDGYKSEGKLQMYNPDMVRFYGDGKTSVRSYAFGVMGMLERERPGCNIMVGPFTSEALMFAEISTAINAIQIGGTARLVQMPFFVLSCDYCLICDEMFAISAYLTKDPAQLSSLYVADILKLAISLLIIVAVIITTMGFPFKSLLGV